MKCPKCGADQAGSSECHKCGVIFSKYLKRLEENENRSENSSQDRETIPDKKSRLLALFFSGLSLLLIAGLAGFWLGNGRLPFIKVLDDKSIARPGLPKEPASIYSRQQTQVSEQLPDLKQYDPGSATGLATIKAIERARDATVLITSPWGSGAGFFIDSHGHIVTNRHVIMVNENELNKLKADRARLKEDIQLEEDNLRYIEKELPKIRKREDRQQLEQQVKIRRRNLARATDVYEKLEARIGSMSLDSYSDIKVTMLSGSEYSVSAMNISNNYDLALLTVFMENSSYIEPSANALSMRQGEKVFTVGNPSGLSHTVTSGIISGYRQYNGQTVIQTDAPINPGNSGGPLIDNNGQVVGVNTKILNNTEGIGFAIPITDVEKEFSFYIQRD